MKEKSKIIKKVVLIILIVIIASIALLIIYDMATVNDQYSIEEANIDIPVFVYHNIVENEEQVEFDYMQTPKELFEKQIKGLQDFGYHFISYEDLQKFKNNEIKLYKKSCLLTFDDGYEGVYENAYPIAKKYNIPFTMFVITENMNTPNVITWEQAKEMQNSGLVTIASHSIDHPEFTGLSTEDAVKNVTKSYEIIEENLGKQNLKIFTYPYGLYKDEQIVELEKLGYIQNLTDNKINKSKNLDLARLHRDYPLNDSIFKVIVKIIYRSIKYN